MICNNQLNCSVLLFYFILISFDSGCIFFFFLVAVSSLLLFCLFDIYIIFDNTDLSNKFN